MQDRGELGQMAGSLVSKIDTARSKALCAAKRFEFGVLICWWGALALAAAASAFGLISAVPAIKAKLSVEPWMIGALSAIATGLEVVRRRSNWRAKSNVIYSFAQTCMQLIMRIQYEMPQDLKQEHLAAISREFRAADETRGERLKAINDIEDEPKSATTKS